MGDRWWGVGVETSSICVGGGECEGVLYFITQQCFVG